LALSDDDDETNDEANSTFLEDNEGDNIDDVVLLLLRWSGGDGRYPSPSSFHNTRKGGANDELAASVLLTVDFLYSDLYDEGGN
jgi:hypothetical protein